MTAMLLTIQDGLKDLFPEIGEQDISPEMKLFEIPEWDSMSSVNLQVFLEDAFKVTVNQNLLDDDTTINEILSFVQEKQA